MSLKRPPDADRNGKWPVTITFLEMPIVPARATLPAPAIQHAIIRAENPTVAFYRFLYDAVGRDWGWTDRKKLSDEKLDKIIKSEHTRIYVLYVKGVPAGYAELDFKNLPQSVDLAYFGIMPEFIGMGLGPYFLDWAIGESWTKSPDALTVNTCTLDHPKALPLYQKMGFIPYSQRNVLIDPIE